MSSTNRPYAHSGKLGGSLVVVPLVGVAAAVFLAMVYAFVTVHVPIAGYISILFILGLSLGVGYACSFALIRSHCRNPKAAAIMGFLIGVFTLYADWVWFEFVLLRDAGVDIPWSEVPRLFLEPGTIWDVAKDISETGWYSIFGMTPKGVFIWILWLIEAVIVIGIITVMSAAAIPDRTYCEPCRVWAADSPEKRLQLTEDQALLERAWAGDIEALSLLPLAIRREYPQLAIETSACPRCEDTNTYRVNVIQPDNEGKEQSAPLTQRVLISEEARAQLLSNEARPSHFQQPPEPQEPQPEA